jgi:ATP-dependent helicase/nuclease subunit A
LPGLKGRAILGTIDRLIVTDDAVHVVDFKSGRPAVNVPMPYRRQLALYRAALSDIFPGRAITAHLVWIDANEAVEIDGKALDEAMAGMLTDGTLRAPSERLT